MLQFTMSKDLQDQISLMAVAAGDRLALQKLYVRYNGCSPLPFWIPEEKQMVEYFQPKM
jgi:hypothetical protein